MKSKGANKQLAKVPIKYRMAITDATRTLVDFPVCENVKPLKNHVYDFRLRVGRYRVFFDFDGQINPNVA